MVVDEVEVVVQAVLTAIDTAYLRSAPRVTSAKRRAFDAARACQCETFWFQPPADLHTAQAV